MPGRRPRSKGGEMANRKRRIRQYELFGRPVNAPEAVQRVACDRLDPPTSCRFCKGEVKLIHNAELYGREFGWPLTYRCECCGARVGTHPGTDIPLGTLADEATQKARKEAHAAFDPIWRGKTPWHRSQAYKALARAMGVRSAHISWFDADECRRIVRLCQSGALI